MSDDAPPPFWARLLVRKPIGLFRPFPWGSRIGLMIAAIVVLLAACAKPPPPLTPVAADGPGAPTLTSIVPNSGHAGGGDTVVLSGTNLTATTVVWLGETQVRGEVKAADDGTSLTVVTPRSRAGAAVDVAVGRVDDGKIVQRVVLPSAFHTSGLSSQSVGIIALALAILALLGTPLFVIIAAATCLGFYLDTQLEPTVGFFLSGVAGNYTPGKGPSLFSDWLGKMGSEDVFIAIPLFTFAGTLMSESRSPTRIINMCRAVIGWLPGGLALVTLITCCFFTAFTGASGVTIIALGGLLFPILLREKYPERFSLGLLTTGGSLGLLVPPSLPVIVYGIVAGVQIGRLFQAALIPGIILVAALFAVAFVVAIRADVPRHEFTWTELKSSFRGAIWEVPLPFIVVGGIYSGLVTATEASAVTACYVILSTVLIYRDLDFRDLFGVVRRTAVLVGAIIVIMGAAMGFSGWLTLEKIPEKILAVMQTKIDDQLTFLIALNIFLLIVGCLMDIFSATLVVVPLIGPVAREFGVDPYHLAVIFLVNLEIGYSTPPVGINLFIASLRFRRPVFALYRASLMFIGVLLVALLLITYIPALSLGMFDRLPQAIVKPAVGLDLSRSGTVKAVTPGSVAAAAGVKKGDKLIGVGDGALDPAQLERALEAAEGEVALHVERDGETVRLTGQFSLPPEVVQVRLGEDRRLECQVALGDLTLAKARLQTRAKLKELQTAEAARGEDYAELDGKVKDAQKAFDTATDATARAAAKEAVEAAITKRAPLVPANKAFEEARRLEEQLKTMAKTVKWRSRFDNSTGMGRVFSTQELKPGEHLLTATVTDKRNHVTQVVLKVTVTAGAGAAKTGASKTPAKTSKTSKTSSGDDDDDWGDGDEDTKTTGDDDWGEGDGDEDPAKKTSDDDWGEGDDEPAKTGE